MNRKKPLIEDEKEIIAALESDGYEAVENEASEIQRYTKMFRERW